MAKPSWTRAADGDWYRASEVVAVKTLPHPDGGFMVTVETHRHDNIDVTGRIGEAGQAAQCRDALAHLLAKADEGTVISYREGGFDTEAV